jgi:hypothetical protein
MSQMPNGRCRWAQGVLRVVGRDGGKEKWKRKEDPSLGRRADKT